MRFKLKHNKSSTYGNTLTFQSYEHEGNHFPYTHFLQVQGGAMRTCAPLCANLYLGEWERILLALDDLAVYMDYILVWYR